MHMPIGYGHLDREVAGDGPPPTIPPSCPNCGYDLRGAVSTRCPECGHVAGREEAAQHAAKTKRAIAEYKEALEWGRRGMIVGAIGLGAAAWGLLLPSGWLQPLLRLVSLLAGPTAFFFGLSVLRAKVHPQLRLSDDETPVENHSSGLAVVFGIADCVLAVFGPW